MKKKSRIDCSQEEARKSREFVIQQLNCILDPSIYKVQHKHDYMELHSMGDRASLNTVSNRIGDPGVKENMGHDILITRGGKKITLAVRALKEAFYFKGVANLSAEDFVQSAYIDAYFFCVDSYKNIRRYSIVPVKELLNLPIILQKVGTRGARHKIEFWTGLGKIGPRHFGTYEIHPLPDLGIIPPQPSLSQIIENIFKDENK